MGKLLLLTLNKQEGKAIDKIIAAIADCISLEAVQTIPVPVSGMSSPGLEIKQSQHRVFCGGEEVNLTRLEYSTLVFSASNPGIVLTQEQIFEAVWNTDNDSCHSSVARFIVWWLIILKNRGKSRKSVRPGNCCTLINGSV